MKLFRNSFRRVSYLGAAIIYASLLQTTLLGCGGGSSGTGVLPITGIARTGSGDPIVGMVIDASTADSEDQDVTGQDGAAMFDVVLTEQNQVQFQFFTPEIQASETLSDIPPDVTSITIEWDFADSGVTTRVTYTFADREPLILEMETHQG